MLSFGKYKGRTGGITPDWTMKVPGEERDIDEWAKKRDKKSEDRAYGFKDLGGNTKNYQKSKIN